MNFRIEASIARVCINVFITLTTIVCLPLSVSAADISFRPSLSVSEEITDNIFESASNKRSEYITRLSPGMALRYQTPILTWDTAYNFEYRTYARNSRSDEYTHNATVKGNISLLDNFLFLDLSDTYSRVSLDIARVAATESSLFLNQTDQNTAIISPFLLWRMSDKSTLRTGYRYSDIRYWGEGIERRENGSFADLNHEISSKLSISAAYAYTHLESLQTRYNKHDLSGGFRYEYVDRSFVFGQIGNSWQLFNSGINNNYLFWNAGVTHDLGLAVATFETRVQTAADPLSVSTKETIYTGRVEKTLQRGMIGISVSYSEFDNTESNTMERRRLVYSATGRYEILQELTANLGVTGERISMQTYGDYPYRLTGTGGLIYALKNELTLALTYTYVAQLRDLNTTAGANEINRVVVELKKGF